MKKIQTLISILIITSLLAFGFYSFFRSNQVAISEIEKRVLQTNINLKENSFLSNNFTSIFESIIADQFYNRYYFVQLKNDLNFAFIDFIFNEENNPLTLRRIGSSPIFQIGSTDLLTPFPIKYDKVIEERLIDRAIQINTLASDYPNVNFYVYKPTQIFETNFFDQANNIESAGKRYSQILNDNLDVPYDSFEFNTFSDYPKYQYFSDHHWNHKGIDRGYQEIVELLLGPDEVTLEPLDENCFNDLTFSGTYTSLSGFVTAGAPFCVYRYDLPEYVYWVNGEFIYDLHDTNAYFHKNINDSNSNHYEDAYGLGSGLVEVHSNSDRQANLLIIGDSYTPPIIPLLAKHYNHIYIVNPIRFLQVYGYDFTYDDFISDYSIENVLFMYVIENYYASDEWGDRYKTFNVHRTEDINNVVQ
jgi:hypothetical protein